MKPAPAVTTPASSTPSTQNYVLQVARPGGPPAAAVPDPIGQLNEQIQGKPPENQLGPVGGGGPAPSKTPPLTSGTGSADVATIGVLGGWLLTGGRIVSTAALGTFGALLSLLTLSGSSATTPATSTSVNRTSASIGQIAKETGLSEREVKDRIHEAKNDIPKGTEQRNPDVVVDLNTGEIHPVSEDGTVGDSIGNIHISLHLTNSL